VLKVSKTVRLRLDCGLLRPEWTGQELVLQRRRTGGADVLRDGVNWKAQVVEWEAAPGEYELLKGSD
jgi:hypothetical protein